jgi:putative dimethyl sulfoxide reductase chaperone
MKKNLPDRKNGNSKAWLEAASKWRMLSLLFQLPTRQSRHELRRLARNAPHDLANLATEWAGVPLALAAAEYHRTLGPGGVPAVESSYDPNALAGRGPLLADIAAFHKAFYYSPEHPPAEVPDHLAAQLDFLSYMAVKIAFAVESGETDNAKISDQAYGKFLKEHLYTWVGAFRERLELSASVFFIRAASLIPAVDPKK